MNHNQTEPGNREALEQQRRINQLRTELNQLAGGRMTEGDFGHCSPDLKEKFLEQVLAFERGEKTTLLSLLAKYGHQFPSPEQLDGQALTDTLRELIRALAEVRVFLEFTDHLSDRELYTFLWRESLREEDVFEPVHPASAWHFDMTHVGTPDPTWIYLKYYADESFRKSWATEFPDDPMPPDEDPPYNRDQNLPKPWDSA
jgi:hypothetical protein